jgi:hypothetical protein
MNHMPKLTWLVPHYATPKQKLRVSLRSILPYSEIFVGSPSSVLILCTLVRITECYRKAIVIAICVDDLLCNVIAKWYYLQRTIHEAAVS